MAKQTSANLVSQIMSLKIENRSNCLQTSKIVPQFLLLYTKYGKKTSPLRFFFFFFVVVVVDWKRTRQTILIRKGSSREKKHREITQSEQGNKNVV